MRNGTTNRGEGEGKGQVRQMYVQPDGRTDRRKMFVLKVSTARKYD